MPKTDKQLLGAWGEEQAALFLIKEGYKIIFRNYQNEHREIDIIAEFTDWQKKKVLSFIEVKARGYDDGSAERAVDPEKQKKIFRAAQYYCLQNNLDIDRTPIQFEQVSVIGDAVHPAQVIRKYVLPVE